MSEGYGYRRAPWRLAGRLVGLPCGVCAAGGTVGYVVERYCRECGGTGVLGAEGGTCGRCEGWGHWLECAACGSRWAWG